MNRIILTTFCVLASPMLQPVLAQHVRPIVASPAEEITVFDPTTNLESKPSPTVRMSPDGHQRVDIPPTVIVHNFYYTGDRDFRGPALTGGPTIVVVNHPLTEERLYLEVQMLPGAPRITYRKDFIDYDFGTERIRLRFLHPLHPHYDPTVQYMHGRRFKDTTGAARKGNQTSAEAWLDRTGIPHAVHAVAAGTVNIVDSSAHGIKAVGSAVTTPFVKVVCATPLGGVLAPTPEERALKHRDAALQRAQYQNRGADATIPTLR